LRFVDPTGLWINNGDGTFTAEEGDTLWGLSMETGKDWRDSDYTGDPKKLQIGQVVNMGKREQRPEGAPVINNTGEALEHYYNGKGKTAWLGDNVLAAVQNSKDQQKREERIRTGVTTSAEGNYGVDVVGEGLNWIFGENNVFNKKGLFFLGDTRVDYKIYSGIKYTIVDFTAFTGDGFWDLPTLFGGPDDGPGPNNERKGATPYAFYPRSWTISFPNPEIMNWRNEK